MCAAAVARVVELIGEAMQRQDQDPTSVPVGGRYPSLECTKGPLRESSGYVAQTGHVGRGDLRRMPDSDGVWR
jgi:hypothetical protein